MSSAHPHALQSGGGGLVHRPAQDALAACQQLARLVGLGDIVVGAAFEAQHLVDRIGRRRQHDDADAGVALAQPAGQREAIVRTGELDVEQDEVGHGTGNLTAHLGAIPGGRHLEVVSGEVSLGGLALKFVVFD